MAESRKSLMQRISCDPFTAVIAVVALVAAPLAVYTAGGSGVPLAVVLVLAAGWRLAALLVDGSREWKHVNRPIDHPAPDED
jgi:hypothetical protein